MPDNPQIPNLAATKQFLSLNSDLAKWAADGVGHCKKNNLKDPHYTATLPFDSKATNDKAAFVKEWNSLAKKYGLPSYSSSQI